MKVTMVKKRLQDGRACDKCIKAEEQLTRRNARTHIDAFVWAEEGNPDSEGMQLATKHNVSVAPFFIVEQDDGSETIYTSALQFIREISATHTNTHNKTKHPTAESTPQEILTWALTQYGRECGIAYSGAEDVVLIDMAVQSGLDFSVFCLDTGRLHPETYRFIEDVRKRYAIDIQLMSPDATKLERFVKQKGLFSFYEDGHKECCGIRKVQPLRRALSSFRAWVTGQRKDQSPTRSTLDVMHEDEAFTGQHDGTLWKFNPLANWTSQQVWDYIHTHDVPYNPLHTKGFVSIGCEPCTRPTTPGEHERAGRWWWEEATKRECGLHIAEDGTPHRPS
jgi:phosphoadenosine phosphosulfate reductase